MNLNRSASQPAGEMKERSRRIDRPESTISKRRAKRNQVGPPAPPAEDVTAKSFDLNAAPIVNALIEGIREGAAVLSLDQTVLTCNRRLADVLKLSCDQIVGQPILRFVDTGDHPSLQALLKSYPEDLKRLDVRLTGGNKRPRPAQFAVQAVGADATRTMILLTTDLRQSRRTKQQLRLQADILANVSDAVVATDEQQHITFWNPSAERLYGFSAEEALGRPVNQVIRSEVSPNESETYIRELREKGKLNVRVVQYDREGNRLFVEGYNSILHAADGRVLGYVGVSHDITEELREEARLQEQAALLDLTHDAIFVRDPQSRLTFWNRGAEELYGWSRAEVVGKHIQDLLQTEFPMPLAEIERVVERDGRWEGELVHTTRAGKTIPVDSRWSLLRDVQGKPIAILQINTNITERKRAELEIRRLNADLERRVTERTAALENEIATHKRTEQALLQSDQQVLVLNRDLERRAALLATANKELESFSYSVSHDLRTPLASIQVFSNLLSDDYGAQLPEGARRYLEFIQSHAHQMEELIQSLLSFSRLTSQPIRKQTVNMLAVVREALDMLQTETQRADLTIEVGEMGEAEADPVLLRQVWMNLIGNALKFTRKRENARIEIGCRPCDRDERVFWVRDNGVGFDQGRADQLFGVFKRLHGEDEYEGHGVGLATVQRIIHRHGGRVWAEGEEGKGATLYFTVG